MRRKTSPTASRPPVCGITGGLLSDGNLLLRRPAKLANEIVDKRFHRHRWALNGIFTIRSIQSDSSL